MRAVLDTNVLVSAIISTGTPYRIYESWRDESFDLIISLPLFSELEEVLARARIRKRIRWPSRADELLRAVQDRAVWVDPEQKITHVAADPDDNRILEAGVEGSAGYIVTGDRHLLDLDEFEGIDIVTPAHFLAILATEMPNP